MSIAKKKGDVGEDVSTSYLIKKGYRIIHRNYRSLFGEVDIIVLKDEVLAFVEVKLRKSSYVNALSSVSLGKRKKIIRTALDFLQKNSLYENYFVRFDVIAIVESYKCEEYKVEHLQDCFRADDNVY